MIHLYHNFFIYIIPNNNFYLNLKQNVYESCVFKCINTFIVLRVNLLQVEMSTYLKVGQVNAFYI